MPKHRATAYLALLLTSIIWGAAGPVIKYGLQYFPTPIFLTYRFAISTILALILFASNKPKNIPKSPSKQARILLYGFLSTTVVLVLLFFGFEKTSAITGTFITELNPILASIAGVLFLNERVTKREQKGTLLAFAGILIIVFEPILTGNGHGESTLVGNLIIAVAVVFDVLSMILAKHILRDKMDPFALSNIAFTIGFITLTPFALVTQTPDSFIQAFVQAPIGGHLSVWFMAIVSGTIGYALWHKGEKSIEIGEVSIFSYLKPIWAAPLAFFWLKEHVSLYFVIGAALSAAGVVIAEKKTSKKKKRRR